MNAMNAMIIKVIVLKINVAIVYITVKMDITEMAKPAGVFFTL